MLTALLGPVSGRDPSPTLDGAETSTLAATRAAQLQPKHITLELDHGHALEGAMPVPRPLSTPCSPQDASLNA
jgi:hypothetical protein